MRQTNRIFDPVIGFDDIKEMFQLSALQDRIRAESVFRNETQIMLATQAAGEGINLQFCHLMINYDLPWNPNRLEQRMGSHRLRKR